MMPLMLAGAGESRMVKHVVGHGDTVRFLESLGFVTGSTVTVIAQAADGLIVNVKDSRIALSKAMASKILV